MDEAEEKLRASMARFDPFLNQIARDVGYMLPRDLHITFNQIIFLNVRNDRPALQHLVRKEHGPDWLRLLSTSIQDVRQGLAASHYHLSEVERLETKMIEI